ncbi:protein BCCIP homolog isoform X1 [Musa acuminata AAA Group]|uniref:protein BCCIP homolog isoform X1 n=1 Tax=Musa acuminata AAA Group TaxID=214697 RepID=UPI0031CE9E72
MGHRQRPEKRRRLSRPRPFLGFSSFARSLLFSHSAPSPDPSASSKPEDGIVELKPSSEIERVESEQEDDEEAELDMMQADFGFFDPKPGDFNGVKLLLRNYLDDKQWDLSGFVDLILEQTTVGTVVKLDEHDEAGDGNGDGDDDAGPFALISALNLGRYEGHKCMKEFKEYLLQVCPDEGLRKRLKPFLEERVTDVGLLVSQRFVNCPYQLVPPLYDALFDEVSWATEDEPTKELQDFFRFKYYLLVTRIFEDKNANQRKAKVNCDSSDPIIYIKPEDEIFQELSLLSFTFRLHAEQLAPRELKNYREKGLVMVVIADEVPKFREKLKSLFTES